MLWRSRPGRAAPVKAKRRFDLLGGGCAVTIAVLVLWALPAAANSYPGMIEISQSGSIQAGLAPPGIPDWSPAHLAAPLVGISATPDEGGAWEAGADGGVFAFGSAQYFGSLPGLHVTPAKPIVGITSTPNGQGYWLVGADGGVFAFGSAQYFGSLPGLHVTPAKPIVGITSPDSDGYWLAGSDGGVFAFGDAPYLGSGDAPDPGAVVAILTSPGPDNYTLVQANELDTYWEVPPPPCQNDCPVSGCDLVVLQNPGPALTAIDAAFIDLPDPSGCAYE
jgi:hypothetical protein